MNAEPFPGLSLVVAIGFAALLGYLTRKTPVPDSVGHQVFWPRMPEIFRLCWADRIAMIWAVIVVGGIMLLQGGSGVSQTGLPAYGQLLTNIVFPLWLFLRLIDLIAAGPTRRKQARAMREGAPRSWREDPLIQVLPPERPRVARGQGSSLL